jgi:dihydropyrimidinase
MPDLLIRNGRVVLPGRGVERAAILVDDGQIAAVLTEAAAGDVDAARVIDADNAYVLPGVIEPHTHFGYGSLTEDFFTETRAAAAAGVTTIITYWRQPVSYLELVPETLEAARTRAIVDYSLHLGLLIEQHLDQLDQLVQELGVSSFKMYMGYKSEEGKQLGLIGCDDGYLFAGLQRLSKYRRAVISVHAENAEIIARRLRETQASGRTDLAAWTEARPAFTEIENVARAAYFARVADTPLQIAHISAGGTLDAVREARERGATVYAETCPHYLYWTKDAPLGTLGKVNPPLRDQADIDALWAGIADGTVDTIGTDHAIIRRERKVGDLWSAATGVGQGMGTLLPVLFTAGVHAGRLTVERLAELISTGPARVFNLYPRKGVIAPGADADLTLVDADLERVVDPLALQSEGDFSVYEGQRLRGWPVMTIARGQVVMQDGKVIGEPGRGRFLPRPLAPAGEPLKQLHSAAATAAGQPSMVA